MDATERALLAETVRDVVARAATGGWSGVDAALAGIEWLEMLEAEPGDAVAIVFDVLGATNAAATALDDVVACALGVQSRADLAVVLPAFGSWDRPASRGGLATARVTTARELLVMCDAGLATVPTGIARVTAIRGVDPDAGLHAVDVDLDGAHVAPLGSDAWDAAVALGRRAVSHQVAGATRTMLDLARTHAVERVQFGRPVARFQAVRHRLAEALVAIESLDAALAAAADAPGPETAALAKAIASRTARAVATHCQQVLAGIGFTTDHPFHRYLKRTMTLDGLFGSADRVVIDLGRSLLAHRHVPTLIEL
jgi:hypothetical protein